MPTPSPVRAIVRTGLLPTLLLAAACAQLGRTETTLPDHMDGHWSQVGLVQDALIHGDLEGTREPARWLAEHTEHPALPQGVLSPVEDMRTFARSVLRATSISDAARCAAEMASACGRCHESAGAGPVFQENSMPEAGQATGRHMLRHIWAADRMWDGLVGPSDRMWRLGATALAEDPLFLESGDTGNQEVQSLARQVHDLGSTARTQKPESRAGLYARLLVTCAQCHQLVGLTPTR